MDTETWVATQAAINSKPRAERKGLFNHFSYVLHSIDDQGRVNVGSRDDIGKLCTHPERHVKAKSDGQ